MLAIPVPFVVSLLLSLMAIILYIRSPDLAKTSCLFLGVCAITTAVVGLRWTVNWPLLQYMQPVLASLIPVIAWYCFTKSSRATPFLRLRHILGPALVLLAVLSQTLWTPPLDALITSIYVVYGIALLRHASQNTLLINISLSRWEGVKRAEHLAGWMLLASAAIDSIVSLDFMFNHGSFSLLIVTIGHLFLLPVLSFAVVVIGVSTPNQEKHAGSGAPESREENANQEMLAEQAQDIVNQLEQLLDEKKLYLDPDLTLSKLSRKLIIPAKKISIAVNLIHKKNISKLVNEYRIQHAQHNLLSTDHTVTQVFMSSGFQTKSNFNREFSRISGCTPSEYRKQNNA
ncbi:MULTISPECIES: helix-turn-helix domain-containing protein [unclassified Agarivorans]|uniref:helix-turn-helix domain-containing protein n=1 Tax=unclassified Agarivorans TaxID=2636026 RepID=UPI0026E4519F|nr:MULTISPECIES: AraC family transcriptional regulator [unclassified Agarivorans]MDO6685884.1 AraC family transcriptional regulator [Agarivorans sp. 3_MG-2023]MDO6713978.1 AraC family transcriptional regulator [Agarivorans sp. 2_MG-2023]